MLKLRTSAHLIYEAVIQCDGPNVLLSFLTCSSVHCFSLYLIFFLKIYFPFWFLHSPILCDHFFNLHSVFTPLYLFSPPFQSRKQARLSVFLRYLQLSLRHSFFIFYLILWSLHQLARQSQTQCYPSESLPHFLYSSHPIHSRVINKSVTEQTGNILQQPNKATTREENQPELGVIFSSHRCPLQNVANLHVKPSQQARHYPVRDSATRSVLIHWISPCHISVL